MPERGTNATKTALRWERQGWDTKEVKREGRGFLRDDSRQHPSSIPDPFPGRFGGEKEKEERREKYPLASDIQEIADTLQSLYASGSAFSKQKTIDINESEYRMLPIHMSKIVLRKIFYIITIYLISFFISIFSSKFGLVFAFSYLPTNIMFLSILFYAYIVYGMQQFVIEDEEQPKTKQLFNIVIISWRCIECFLLVSMAIYVILHFTFEIWFFKLEPVLKSVKYYFTSKDIFSAMEHLMYLSIILNSVYFFFVYLVRRRFKKIQQKNMLALYHQFDLHKAASKKLDFEI